MKKLFTILLAAIGFQLAASAQCTPDNSLTKPGLYPASLPDGAEGASYSEVIQFKFPKDTVKSGLTAHIDSAHIDTIENFPLNSNFKFQCNHASRMYPGGGNGCALLTCNPPVGSAKTYSLKVSVTAYCTILGASGIPVAFSDTIPFKVKTANSGFWAIQSQGTGFSLGQNYPDPLRSNTTITYTTDANQQVSFKVYDLTGRLVSQEMHTAVQGMNRISFGRNNLKSGLYFYSIQAGGNQLTRRMMIED